jgi:hypothetical protein
MYLLQPWRLNGPQAWMGRRFRAVLPIDQAARNVSI